MSDITLTLIGKPGCHLCDDARIVVNEVVAEVAESALRMTPRPRLILEELSIEEDRVLFDEYGEQIPVLLINGKVHNFWRIDPVRLTHSLKGLL